MKKYACILWILASSIAGFGYTRITVSTGEMPKWSSMPISYWINEKGLSQITNGSEFAAIHASFHTWETVASADVRFEYKGTTPIPGVAHDGQNVISFSDTTTPLGSSTIAATFSFFKRETGADNVMHLVYDETDIAFNPQFAFSTSAEVNKFDIQSVLTHEIGHVLGLDHSSMVSSVMVPFSVPSLLDQRTLAYDDKAGITEIYPNGSAPAALGQIGGIIRLSGSPILGAHVVAVNASGIALVSTLSQPDGSYVLRSVPAGTYNVFAEPLDLPITKDNVGGGFYTNTRTDFGTTYVGNVSRQADASIIAVNAGGTATADIDVLAHSATGLNLTGPAFGIRVARGARGRLTVGGEDIAPGVSFSVSSSAILIGPPEFGGRISSIASTSAQMDISISSSAPIGPVNLAVNRDADASVVPGAFVITDPGPLGITTAPASGPSNGGMPVTITGFNFRSGAQVYFGGLAATEVTVVDSGTILANTPRNSPGAANVVVINSDGTWGSAALPFTYEALLPMITRVLPLSGPPATLVTIEGENFGSGLQNVGVQFNGVTAKVVSATPSVITTIVPFGITTGPITISVFGQSVTGPVFTVTTPTLTTNLARPTFNFIDATVASGGTNLSFSNTDDSVATASLPFTVALFRDVYLAGSPVSITTNGFLSLQALSVAEFQNGPLPGQSVPRPNGGTAVIPPSVIAPFWDDLLMETNSTISTRTVGNAPNRQFVVQWSNMSIADETGNDLKASLTFEVVLFEGSYDIQFLYSTMNGPFSDGSSATIGAQDATRTTAIQASFNQSIVSSGFFKSYHFDNGVYTELTASPPELKIIPSVWESSSEFTGLALVAPTASTVVLRAYDSNGALIGGPGVQNPATVSLAAGQQYTRLLSEIFGFETFNGWVEVEASAPGLGVFTATGARDVSTLDGSVARETSADFVLFHAGASAILVNPSSRTANVTITSLGTGGTQSVSILPMVQFVTTLAGPVRVQSSEPLAAIERTTAPGKLGISAAVPVTDARATLVFPQAVIGGGYASSLTLANVSGSAQTVTVAFGASKTTVQMNPGTSSRIPVAPALQADPGLNVGAVTVTGDTPGIVGVLDLENESALVTIGARPAATEFVFPHVVNGSGFYTGIAFASGGSAANVTIEVYEQSGGTPKSGTIMLQSNAHLARMIHELVEGTATQLGGYIRIRSDQPIWVWEILGTAEAMASVPPL